MPVSIQTDAATFRPWRAPLAPRELTPLLENMLRILGIEDQPVELFLVNDAVMARYNQDFLGCPGPTNVLAFPVRPQYSGHASSLILNLDAVAREAFLYGQDTEAHMRRLLAHGLAHIAGYDHGAAMDAVVEAVMDIERRS